MVKCHYPLGHGLPKQHLEVMNYMDTTIAEDEPFMEMAFGI